MQILSYPSSTALGLENPPTDPTPKKIPANMNTSAIPGMNHRIILQLAAIAFLAAAGTGTAETITITPDECPLKPVTPVP